MQDVTADCIQILTDCAHMLCRGIQWLDDFTNRFVTVTSVLVFLLSNLSVPFFNGPADHFRRKSKLSKDSRPIMKEANFPFQLHLLPHLLSHTLLPFMSCSLLYSGLAHMAILLLWACLTHSLCLLEKFMCILCFKVFVETVTSQHPSGWILLCCLSLCNSHNKLHFKYLLPPQTLSKLRNRLFMYTQLRQKVKCVIQYIITKQKVHN